MCEVHALASVERGAVPQLNSLAAYAKSVGFIDACAGIGDSLKLRPISCYFSLYTLSGHWR
jgi:hypothetical protein